MKRGNRMDDPRRRFWCLRQPTPGRLRRLGYARGRKRRDQPFGGATVTALAGGPSRSALARLLMGLGEPLVRAPAPKLKMETVAALAAQAGRALEGLGQSLGQAMKAFHAFGSTPPASPLVLGRGARERLASCLAPECPDPRVNADGPFCFRHHRQAKAFEQELAQVDPYRRPDGQPIGAVVEPPADKLTAGPVKPVEGRCYGGVTAGVGPTLDPDDPRVVPASSEPRTPAPFRAGPQRPTGVDAATVVELPLSAPLWPRKPADDGPRFHDPKLQATFGRVRPYIERGVPQSAVEEANRPRGVSAGPGGPMHPPGTPGLVPAGKPRPPLPFTMRPPGSPPGPRLATCPTCNGDGGLLYVNGMPQWLCKPCGGCGSVVVPAPPARPPAMNVMPWIPQLQAARAGVLAVLELRESQVAAEVSGRMVAAEGPKAAPAGNFQDTEPGSKPCR